MAGGHVLVTGATGFIGRSVCANLLSDGRNVHALVRSAVRAQGLPEHPRLDVHVMGGPQDAVSVIRSEPFEGIVHLATHFVARHSSPDQLVSMLRANVELGSVLAEEAAGSGIPVVSASSVWQHFEGRAYSPVSLYAATKQAQDDILTYYASVEGLPWTRLVLGDTYGPGDDRGKLLSQLLKAARSGVPMPASSGMQLWDAVHAQDVAEAFRLCLDEQAAAPNMRTHQLSSGEPVTIRHLAEVLEGVIGQTVPVAWGERADRGREMLRPWVVAEPPPGWEPQVELAQGLRELWRAINDS